MRRSFVDNNTSSCGKIVGTHRILKIWDVDSKKEQTTLPDNSRAICKPAMYAAPYDNIAFIPAQNSNRIGTISFDATP
jgi:hypothetical protein